MNDQPGRSGYGRWAVLLATWGLLAATLGLFLLNRETPVPESWGVAAGKRDTALALIDEIFLTLYVLPASLMGVLILHRHPRHRMGWLLAWAGLISALPGFATELTVFANFTRPALSGLGMAAAWLLNFVWILPTLIYFWLFSVFPDGKLPSARWRWVQWLVLAFAAAMAGAVLNESPMHSAFSLPNPLLVDFPQRISVYQVLYGLGAAALVLAVVGLVALVISRFRQARGVERQQFKWLGLGGLVAALLLILGLGASVGLGSVLGQWLVNYAIAVLPIGVGVAVLRYRLYDIDLVIRRTLVYSMLTALLALVYFGSVVVLQNVLTTVTGQQSPVAVVLSTLAIAALFFPLRGWIQNFIDRRFYRRKYDAVKLLEAFAATARDETDLTRLTQRLSEVVEETMQPESASIWLVGETRPNLTQR